MARKRTPRKRTSAPRSRRRKQPPPPARAAAPRAVQPSPRPTAAAPTPERSRAFITSPRFATDELAEELGESFVLSATSGEDPEEHYERERPEEDGGPFLETSGRTEFAYGVDESNPEDAEPAPWPTVSLQGRRAYRPGGPR
ncbi:MAG TPA: hypothetical protein VEJ89_08370 [Myxococcaceae bacterium]|jgi:hypothetical protein|nr:hypothetical protein [Myxococcaceae bacterium]